MNDLKQDERNIQTKLLFQKSRNGEKERKEKIITPVLKTIRWQSEANSCLSTVYIV